MKGQYTNPPSCSTNSNSAQQTKYENLIGVGKLCILYPNIEHNDKEVGYALVKATSFTKECLYFKDIDPTSNEEILYKDWTGIGLLTPFNDTNSYYKRKDPVTICPGMDVLALWSNPDGSYTSVYYPAKLGYNNNPSKVVVQYERGVFQSVHLQAEVCGFRVPTVIRKICAFGSLPLKDALKKRKDQEKRDRQAEKLRKEHAEWQRGMGTGSTNSSSKKSRNHSEQDKQLTAGFLASQSMNVSEERTGFRWFGESTHNSKRPVTDPAGEQKTKQFKTGLDDIPTFMQTKPERDMSLNSFPPGPKSAPHSYSHTLTNTGQLGAQSGKLKGASSFNPQLYGFKTKYGGPSSRSSPQFNGSLSDQYGHGGTSLTGNTRPGSAIVNEKPTKKEKRGYGQPDITKRSAQRRNSQTQRSLKRPPPEDLRDVPKPTISQAPKAQIGRRRSRVERKNPVPHSLWGRYEVPYPILYPSDDPLGDLAKERRAKSEENDADVSTDDDGKVEVPPKGTLNTNEHYLSHRGEHRKWLKADTTEVLGKKIKAAPYVMDW